MTYTESGKVMVTPGPNGEVDTTIPAEHHTVKWTIDRIGWTTNITGTVECHAPEGAFCRLTCAEGCGSETYPCGTWDDDAGRLIHHQLTDSGECNVIPFLEADELTEFYGGGQPETPLVSGPIEVEWEGEGYAWRYPQTDA
jgi:hypothetical protein